MVISLSIHPYILCFEKIQFRSVQISDIWLPAEEITHSNLEHTTFVFYNGNSHKKRALRISLIAWKEEFDTHSFIGCVL